MNTRWPAGTLRGAGVDEKNIWRTATLLIKQHGGKAGELATLRGIEMMEKNDTDGQAVWKPGGSDGGP